MTRQYKNELPYFTRFPNVIFNFLLVSKNLNKREHKVAMLIIRLTYGCIDNQWVKLKQADLSVIGISSSHAKAILISLLAKEIIIKNETRQAYRINEESLLSKLTKKETISLELLGNLIGKQLKPKSYLIGNELITEKATFGLPEREDPSSQNGNKLALPLREVSRSEKSGFTTPKEILKERDIKAKERSRL